MIIIMMIITYIYHTLINALSAHMIHINLNTIFYTHVEHSSTDNFYIKYYMENRQTDTHTHTHTHTHGNEMHAVWQNRAIIAHS